MADETAPTLIDGKDVEEILCPSATLVDFKGKQLAIYPMTDEQLIATGDALEVVARVFKDVVELDGGEGVSEVEVYAAIPALFVKALPYTTKIIAGSLNVKESVVSKMKLADRVGLLRGIFEAEDVPLLLKNVSGLVSIYGASKPAQETKAQAEV